MSIVVFPREKGVKLRTSEFRTQRQEAMASWQTPALPWYWAHSVRFMTGEGWLLGTREGRWDCRNI